MVLGPDAFFIIGTTDSSPNSADAIILPYPFDNKHYDFDDPTAPILERFHHEDLTLILPPEVKVQEIKWLSVWCRAFRANFGDLIWPSTLKLQSTTARHKTNANYRNLVFD